MTVSKKPIGLSDELWSAIAAAAGDAPRASFIESELWRLKSIRTAAARIGVEKPDRPADGRGKWKRKPAA